MAKIGDLVKTYRLLNDPNAPDWNVKFAGAVIIALTLVAGATALVWTMKNDPMRAAPEVASVQDAPDAGADECAPLDPAAPTAPSALPTPCAAPAVLP